MKISNKGIALIKEYEGCKLKAYVCPAKVLTIGWGSTGSHVKSGETITQAEADALLMKDLVRFENGVEKLVTVPMTQGMYDALVSFSFNLGLGNLKSSTLLKKVNAGDKAGAANEFKKWVKAGGVTLAGLVRRREAERKLFLS